jgi:hypothetical protein
MVMPARPGSRSPREMRNGRGAFEPMLPARSRERTTTANVPGARRRPLRRRLEALDEARAAVGAPHLGLDLLARGAEADLRRAAVAARQQLGPVAGLRPDVGHPHLGRRRVEGDGVAQLDGAALALEREADAVGAVGRALAVVGDAVPADAPLLPRGAVEVLSDGGDDVAALVDDRGAHVVALAQRERHAHPVEAAVLVGREHARAHHALHDGRRALEALGDEERGERRDDERGEDAGGDPRHSRMSSAFGTRQSW